MLLQENVVALIEGSHTKYPTCVLSKVTGIPLIRLYGNDRPCDQCENAIEMSGGYRDYAYATLDILNTFQWNKIALVLDGTNSLTACLMSVKGDMSRNARSGNS